MVILAAGVEVVVVVTVENNGADDVPRDKEVGFDAATSGNVGVGDDDEAKELGIVVGAEDRSYAGNRARKPSSGVGRMWDGIRPCMTHEKGEVQVGPCNSGFM